MSQIPQKKHSKEELANLRARAAMQMAGQPVVNPYNEKIAKIPIIAAGYLSALFAPLYLLILKFQDKISYELTDFKIMLGSTLLTALIAAFIFFRRTLSRHHASFAIIIALISSFSLVYLVNKDESLKREVLAMLGKDYAPAQLDTKSEAKRIVEQTIKNIPHSDTSKVNTPGSDTTKERIQLTPEEQAEMEKIFTPLEERRTKELDAAKKARSEADKTE